MSGAMRKPPPPGTASGARTPSTNPSASPSTNSARTPSRASTPTSAAANGITRTRSSRGVDGSPVSARAAVRRPAPPSGLSSTSTASLQAAEEEDARIENAALVDELKQQLQKAEGESEGFQKQLQVLQTRLDDALKEQGKLEERMHEEEERVEMLENEKRESQRQRNELERIFEAERVTVMKDKEDSQAREDELHEVIQRLKDNLSQKEIRPGLDEDGRLPRQASLGSPPTDADRFAPPTTLQRSNSRNNSKLLLQKDKVIESLRLELAEVQVKLVEMENMGGTRIQEVEKKLMETRMTNARLMEENESFQVLLSDKTLNGDFSPAYVRRISMEERTPSRGGGQGTSLADELGGSSPTDADPEHRRLEAEISSLKDQNKALTLYINKIIERLLQHQGFESVLSNAQEGPHGAGVAVDKSLPPIPPPKDKENEPAQGQSFLQRARSVVAGPNKPRPRPMSYMPSSSSSSASPPRYAPTVTENPETAPSIPLGRSQSVSQRNRMSAGNLGMQTRSISGHTIPGAAGIVSNMYKPPADQISPSLASPTRTSTSFFSLPMSGSNPNAGVRKASISQLSSPAEDGGRDAALAALTGGSEQAVDTPSPPRSIASSQDQRVQSTVFAGKQVRQLRLVQQNPDAAAAEEARLKANRGSWIGGVTGWFGKREQSDASPPPQMGPLQQSSGGAERSMGLRNVSWGDER